jgi:Mu-like prophage protein gp36
MQPFYLDVDDFIARVGEEEVRQLAGTGLRDHREIDRERIAACLVHADGVVDGYVRARYPRRFAVVPDVLKGIAHDIARYRLRTAGGQQREMSETVKNQFDEAMKLLRDIADGRLALDSNDDGVVDANATNKVHGVTHPSRMNDALKGWL